MEGFPKAQQCLIVDNKQLDDSCTLADQNIWKESTVLLVLKQYPRGTMKIFVKTISEGTTIILKVHSSDTIEDIEVKIYKKVGSLPKHQHLISTGRKLENHCTLAYYNIMNESVLHLAIRL